MTRGRQRHWGTYTVAGQTLGPLNAEIADKRREALRKESAGDIERATVLNEYADYLDKLAQPYRDLMKESVRLANEPTRWEKFRGWVKKKRS